MSDDIGTYAARHIDNEALQAEIRDLYEDVDRQIAAHQPCCINRGRCCNFKAYGHRLYVSTAELSLFAAARGEHLLPVDPTAGSCPYHIDGVCTARGARPLGCRIFFCESESDAWPNEIYESALSQLQAIAAAHGVEYRYVEWLSALASITPPAANRPSDNHAAEQKIDPRSLPVINS